MTRSLLAAIAALALLVMPSVAGADTITIRPGDTFAGAYQRAQAGDTIKVEPGVYPRQDVPAGTKAVTFQGGPGVTVRHLSSSASNVVYDAINIDRDGQQGQPLHLGGSNATFRNATVGDWTDEKVIVTGANHLIDRVVFHDAVLTPAGEDRDVHMECVYAIGVPGLTVRNSVFRNCAIMDLFFTYGSWWSPQPPAYGGVTLENNVFAHSKRAGNQGRHYYTLYIGWIGPRGDGDPLDGWTIRNNTFEGPATVGTRNRTATGSRWVGNLGSWDCTPGMTFRYNVGSACSSQDRPASSFGWVDPAAFDFRLAPGSPAVDAADPRDAPELDAHGTARSGAPDAGAFELHAGPTPTPTPSPEPEPAPTPTPEPAYAPACAPTCDEQLEQLRADAAAHASTIAQLTAELDEVAEWRDRWKGRAEAAEGQLEHIRGLWRALNDALRGGS